VTVAVVLLATTLVIVLALLAAVGAGKVARMDGATYPAAVKCAGTVFAAALTLACVVSETLAALLR
jgi:hypothetical protein